MGGVIGVLVLGALVAVQAAADPYFRKKWRALNASQLCARAEADTHLSRFRQIQGENKRAADELKSWNGAIDRARQEVERIRAIVDARAKAQSARYHVFDRLEGHGGEVWLVTVDATTRNAAWTGQRQYLVVADNERQARERACLRFSRSSGYQVAAAGPSPLTELIVQMQTAEFGRARERFEAIVSARE